MEGGAPPKMEQESTKSRYPQLHLGRFTIPALIVPIAISVVFLAHKIYEHNHPILSPFTPLRSPKSNPTDAENLKEPASRETPSEKIAQVITPIVFFLVLFAILASPRLPRMALLSIFTLNILVTFVTCICFDPGSTRLQAGTVAIAAALPLLQALLGYLPPWSWTFAGFVSILAVLSWWPPSRPSNFAQEVYSMNAVLLLGLIGRMHIPVRYWPCEPGVLKAPPRLMAVPLLAALLLHLLWQTSCKWLGFPPAPDQVNRKTEIANRIRSDLPHALVDILGRGIYMGISMLVVTTTSFAASCIGFQGFISGKADPVSFKPNLCGSLAGLLRYFFIWWRGEDSPLQMLRNCVDAPGWIIIGSLSLGVLLMSTEQMWN